LTAAAEPTEYIKAEALLRDVPLILVEGNTLSTAEALDGLLQRADPYSPWKVQRFRHLMGQHLDMAALSSALT
jgi:BioD-like phosphotransacetylase family protein